MEPYEPGPDPEFWHLLIMRFVLLMVAALFLAVLWREGGWLVRIAGVVLAAGLVVIYWGESDESKGRSGPNAEKNNRR
jgi:uncharacterized membrane protein YecN with MAPEG domain